MHTGDEDGAGGAGGGVPGPPCPAGEAGPGPHLTEPGATQRNGRAAPRGRGSPPGRVGGPQRPPVSRPPPRPETLRLREPSPVPPPPACKGHRFETSLFIFSFFGCPTVPLCCGGRGGSAVPQSPNEFGKASNTCVYTAAVKVVLVVFFFNKIKF